MTPLSIHDSHIGRIIMIATCPDLNVRLTHEEGDTLARALLAEREIVQWLLPIVTGNDDHETNARTMMLAVNLLQGVDGREAILQAMLRTGEAP